jgi:hypothetical protein
MKTIEQVVTIIEQCRDNSEMRWEMAVDTDDSDREFAADSAECLQAYDDAIVLNGAYAGYIGSARSHLLLAKGLESGAGDAQDAIRALNALDDLDPDADR